MSRYLIGGLMMMIDCLLEQIQFGRVDIPNLTLPGNPGSNLILVTEIEIQFVFPDESRKLPRIQLRGNIFLRRLSVASFAIDHPSWGQTFLFVCFDYGPEAGFPNLGMRLCVEHFGIYDAVTAIVMQLA
jgi:hypothetical protein